jgi:hypothetical protein
LPHAACLLACVAIDLFYFPRTTVFPDEQRFLASAIRLAASGDFWSSGGRAWEMPGTALFFAPAIWLFGPHDAVLPIRLLQALLVVIQSALIAATARRIFQNATTGFIAACIGALYPFFLFYQGLLLSETLFDTLMMGGVASLYWWRERGLRIDAALVVACLCFVAAIMTKATLTILPPFLLAATAWLAGTSWRRVIAVFVTATCLYAAFMSPWWVRNAMLFGTFVPFTTNGAENLYLGNNPHNADSGIDWATDVDPAVANRMFAIPDELTRQHAFAATAIAYIKSDPAAFFRAVAKKFVRFWNIVPNAAEFKGGLYSTVSAASFGPILAFALICVAWQRRQWRLLAPIYLIVGYFTFVHVVTIASLRYRLPLEPLLIVLAADQIAACVAAIRRRVAQHTPTAGNASLS